MAAIDKIYGTPEQWHQLHDFLEQRRPDFLRYLYPLSASENENAEVPVSNFSYEADAWLKRHCTLLFVQERLKEQYSDERLRGNEIE